MIYQITDNQNEKHILTKIKYKNYEIYMINNIVITKEEYLGLLNLGLLELLEEKTIINYIKDGNRYRVTKNNNIENTNKQQLSKILKKTRRI